MTHPEPAIRFTHDITAELVKASATDTDVVASARVSTLGSDTEQRKDEDADQYGLINFLMKNRHGTPFEHATFTWLVSAPIFVWREHMRHRVASYNEESGRYKVLEPVFYLPAPDRPIVQTGKPGYYEYVEGSTDQITLVGKNLAETSEIAYHGYLNMLNAGVAREVARMALPLNIFSAAYVTMNARALMNFLSLRQKNPDSTFPSYPQREIEMVADQYEAYFAQLMPLTHRAFVENGRVAP